MGEFEWPKTYTKGRRRTLAILLWDLHDNGPFVDEAGKAVTIIEERMVRYGQHLNGSFLGKSLRELDDLGLIKRDVRHRRTYRIGIHPGLTARDLPSRPENMVLRPEATPKKKTATQEEAPPNGSHSMALEAVGDVTDHEETPTNRILFAISLLSGALEDLSRLPAEETELLLDRRLSAANALIERNAELQVQLDEARAKNTQLMAANRQLEQALVAKGRIAR